jgi:transposase-like protein
MLIDKSSYDEFISCHEHNEKKRCPFCGNLRTKKHGFIYSRILTNRGRVKRKTQRYLCRECGKTFTYFGTKTRKRTSDRLKKRAVLDFVLTKNSLREVGKRYEVSPTTILNWLSKISSRMKVYDICKSRCSGVIQLDGKEIKLGGKKKSIFLSIDANTKQPLTYQICNGENKKTAEDFLLSLKQAYPAKIRGVISDFGRGKCFLGVVNKVFPQVPHQVCLVHFERYVWMFLPRTKRSEFYLRNSLLKSLINKVIKAPSRKESLDWLNKLNHLKPFFRASYHNRFIRSINKNYEYLTKYFDYDYLITNTNRIENMIRQLNRKLKNLDGFKSEKNLVHFMKIWFIGYYEKYKN